MFSNERFVGDECTLLDNSDLVQWRVRGVDGVEAMVPSVVFRIPPPDPQLTSLLSRLHAEFERLKVSSRRTNVNGKRAVLESLGQETSNGPLQHGARHNAAGSRMGS